MAVQVVLSGESDTAEDLLAVAGGRQRGLPGGGLREQRAQLVVRRGEGCLGAFERYERLGQPVPHGLERRERPAELDPVYGVRPGEGEHRPAGAREPPADRAPARRERRRARRPRHGHHGHHAQRQFPVNRAASPVDALPDHPGATRVRQWQRAAGREPARRQKHVVEQRRVRSRLAEQPERQRCRDLRHAGEQVPPAQLGQREVEDTAGRRQHRLPERLGEQVKLGLVHSVPAGRVHAHSFPRSSSRRAMMLRWISAVPP
jgi:hypothetical protein